MLHVDPQSETALSLLRQAAVEIRALYDDVLPPDRPWPVNDPLGPREVYIVAYRNDKPVGCGALREVDRITAEVRRMYVLPEHRGSGVGRAMLTCLEAEARRLGYQRLRLETGNRQYAAIALYEAFGFRRSPAFGRHSDDPTSVCFELPLPGFSHRLATMDDWPALKHLMDASIRTFLGERLDPARVEASFDFMGVDTQLIKDGTYFVVERGDRIAGCGGWGRRATMYGGDHTEGRNARLLDPAIEPARVRAMYTHPDFARRGVGRLVLSLCEARAAREGFRSLELVATVAGEPLYLACGFTVIERIDVPTSRGVTVPCARMTKSIA